MTDSFAKAILSREPDLVEISKEKYIEIQRRLGNKNTNKTTPQTSESILKSSSIKKKQRLYRGNNPVVNRSQNSTNNNLSPVLKNNGFGYSRVSPPRPRRRANKQNLDNEFANRRHFNRIQDCEPEGFESEYKPSEFYDDYENNEGVYHPNPHQPYFGNEYGMLGDRNSEGYRDYQRSNLFSPNDNRKNKRKFYQTYMQPPQQEYQGPLPTNNTVDPGLLPETRRSGNLSRAPIRRQVIRRNFQRPAPNGESEEFNRPPPNYYNRMNEFDGEYINEENFNDSIQVQPINIEIPQEFRNLKIRLSDLENDRITIEEGSIRDLIKCGPTASTFCRLLHSLIDVNR